MALKTTLTQPTASGTGTVIATPGMPGAANPVRIVGRNASGAPTTGTFQVGDVVVNTDGTEYVCSAAGTPGTWVQIGAISYGTPSNIDASLTSLSTGSLTTVARADHVHTISNAMTFIGRVTLSVDASSLTAINIPQTFNNLMLLIETKTTWTGATDTAALRFNGLSTAVYGSYTSSTATNQIDFATQGTLSATTAFSCGTMFIYNYTDTAKHKRVSLNNAYYITAFNDGYNFWQQGTFLSNNAITSVQLLNTSGQSLKAGSRITIYGMP